MKQARWVVAAVLVGVVGAAAWLLVSRQQEAKPSRSGQEEPAQVGQDRPAQLGGAPVTGVVAADLSQVMPTGAVAMIHYQGGEQLKSAYEQSALGQILNDSRMQEFLRKPRQALYRQLASQTNAPSADIVEQLHHWLVGKESVLAVYVDDKPAVAGCLRLGADAPKAREVLRSLVRGGTTKSPRTFHGHEVTMVSGGGQHAIAKDVFVFASDASTMHALLERIDSGSPQSETVRSPALDVGEKIGWAVVDTPLALRKARTSIKEQASSAKFDAVVKELGVEQIGRIELATGFDGAGIRMAARIPGLAADRGLLAFYGGATALNEASLRLIPKDVASASAARINLAAVWDTVMRIVEATAGHEDFQQFQAKLAELEGEARLHVKEELVDSVGDVVIFYSKPGPSAMVAGEIVLELALKDPQKFAQGMDRLLDYANKQLTASQRAGQGPTMGIQRSKVGDVDVRYFAGLPMFSPAYAVSGSRAFLAISPMALNAAIAQAGQPQSSLLDNPDYQNARAKLPGKVVAVAYENTHQLVAGLYGMVGMIGPMFAGKPDAPIDLALLPPLSSLQEKVFGGVTVATIDGGELMTRQYSSLGLNLSSLAGGGVMAGMMLPALNQAREKARRVNCLNNLKQIGLACHMYADKHNDRFPAKLEDLTDDYHLSSQVFHCPSAAGQTGMSYAYVSGLTTKDSEKILAYDADNNHRGLGRNVLFCDGHVQWITESDFQQRRPQQQ